jgi:hypothetical protein
MTTISQLMDALVALEAKEGWADICDARYDSNPYDEEAERAFDQAYREEWEAFGKAVKMLVDLTGMDVSVANTLLRAKREKVMGIVKRWRGNK